MILTTDFYNRDACKVAQSLLGKVIRHKVNNKWLAARIIETEAYYMKEKGSHSSLGFTEKRKAMFMPAGTIYMYYARGKDSLNISVKGKGNAVLIKSAYPFFDKQSPESNLVLMQKLNPNPDGSPRDIRKLCKGQTLLCATLDIQVVNWDQQQFDQQWFYIDDVGADVDSIIQTTRMGIPQGRDHDLPYRFVDYRYAPWCTQNPLTRRQKDYKLLNSLTK